MESALKIASYRPSAPGTGLGLADGSRRLGRRGGPTAERRMVRVWGRPTRSHRDRPGRCGSHVRRAERHIQTNPPVTAFTDGGGGRRGAWHQLGLLMGSCSWVASPQICVTGEEMLLAGTTRTTTAQRQTWCRVESSGARWAVAAGQLRAGCARLDARKVLGRAGLHLVRSAAGALPQAERRAPFERRSSMAPM